jgi:16S rRNA processing protein RimM
VPESQKTEWATIGQVVALFGIRGELKVRLFTDIPDRFAHLASVHFDPDYRCLEIEHVRPYKNEMIVLKLRGIDDANTAETLCGQRLLIPADQLAHLPPGSYYQHDILDLAVILPDGRELGRIVDILQTGSNDVYVVKVPDGKQVLIPAIREVVRQVDLIHHTMSIDPLPGLLESVIRENEDEEEIHRTGEDS